MIDTQFYDALGPVRLDRLADLAQARLHNPEQADVAIRDVGPLDARTPDAIGYLDNARGRAALESGALAACFVRAADADALAGAHVALVVAERPQAAFARACAALARPRAQDFGDGVHPSARVALDAVLESGARVAQDAAIGAGARIGANAVIGCGVAIGEGCEVGAGAVVTFARVDARSSVGANTAIGQPGFGLTEGDAESGAGLVELPHMGRVIIGEDVRIGACCAIDRGMLADTEIGAGSKIDNLVQIAHNVRIGRSCVLAGCCGVSGSAVIEDGAMLGGSVGVSDHVVIGAGARVAGGSALVMRDVPAGETWAGAPARPFRRFFREIAALERLARRGDGET